VQPHKASRTAEYMAFYRALESARRREKRLFTDPFGVHFLRPSLRLMVWLSGVRPLGFAIARYADRRAPGARTSAIARTRLIDDLVTEALGEGLPQMVILGAGFDCRLHRLSGTDSVAGFEVDHPATLAAKLSVLRRRVPNLPATTRFVEIDFRCQCLRERLKQAGFDCARPAIFLWEGVTNYLAAASVDDVLGYVAGCSAGSRLIFTYVHRGVLEGSPEFPDGPTIMRNVAAMGEPWTFGIIPEEISSYLANRGLRLERDWSARQYRAKYFGSVTTAMNGYDFYHVALARVPEGHRGSHFAGFPAHQKN
jgi:methyltransferase (TIGR00027 family)